MGKIPPLPSWRGSGTLLFRPPTQPGWSLRDFQQSSGSTSGYILSRACWEILAGMGERQPMVTAICQHQLNVCSCEAGLMLNIPQESAWHFCTSVFEKTSTSTTSKSSFYHRTEKAFPTWEACAVPFYVHYLPLSVLFVVVCLHESDNCYYFNCLNAAF